MTPTLILSILAVYFILLIAIAHYTSRGATTTSFFTADRSSKWYLVAFGMIGTSLSGVTFISVPGQVGITAFSYLQVVLGYLVGYFIIATVLMPLYYRMQLTSIYTYLTHRFGFWSYKTGAAFFLLARSVGSSARFYLVLGVMQYAVFDLLGVPFWLTTLGAIGLIWLYTYQGGVKTIIITDTLQSTFMLLSVGLSLYFVSDQLSLGLPSMLDKIWTSPSSQIFHWDPLTKDYFWKQFLSGAFIAIVMTGLDQDMMQKNLTCKNIGEAQKNMFWFVVTLFIMNVMFLFLGAALYLFVEQQSIALPDKPDQLFPMLALNHFSVMAGVIFVLGIIAATYASTDSALTALTTSFCVDFLDIGDRPETERKQLKHYTHIGFSVLIFILVLLFKAYNDGSLINTIFQLAGYTYGPLLGLYFAGLFTKLNPKDQWVPTVAIMAPIATYILVINSKGWFWGYQFGFESLLLNGALTLLGLTIIHQSKKEKASSS